MGLRADATWAGRSPGNLHNEEMSAQPYEHIVIEAVSPTIDCGRHPVKGIVGETCTVEAAVYRHGHERVRAVVRWTAPGDGAARELPMTPINPGLDRWRAELRLEPVGRHRFTIAAWTDR